MTKHTIPDKASLFIYIYQHHNPNSFIHNRNKQRASSRSNKHSKKEMPLAKNPNPKRETRSFLQKKPKNRIFEGSVMLSEGVYLLKDSQKVLKYCEQPISTKLLFLKTPYVMKIRDSLRTMNQQSMVIIMDKGTLASPRHIMANRMRVVNDMAMAVMNLFNDNLYHDDLHERHIYLNQETGGFMLGGVGHIKNAEDMVQTSPKLDMCSAPEFTLANVMHQRLNKDMSQLVEQKRKMLWDFGQMVLRIMGYKHVLQVSSYCADKVLPWASEGVLMPSYITTSSRDYLARATLQFCCNPNPMNRDIQRFIVALTYCNMPQAARAA